MLRLLFAALLVVGFVMQATSQTPPSQITNPPTKIIPLLNVQGAIGPATTDYLISGIEQANKNHTQLIIITLNTPGGLSSSLRDINMAIMASNIPVACFVYPQGARAASAGTYILYACHIAAMAPATTLGAATPVNISPPNSDKQGNENESASAMEKKMLNDAIAYIRSLAQLRGRNEEWAELAVKEAATLTDKEALAKNVINLLADSPQDLLLQLNNYPIKINNQERLLNVTDARLETIEPDWRNEFLATITNPNVAYILMLIGIYGLLLEFYSPGMGVAGITGAISLFIALYAFQLLPISYAGAGLLILGIVLIIFESMAPSFGIFGIGGVVAFILGSIFLVDAEQAYFRVSTPLIAAIATVFSVLMFISLAYLWRSRQSKIVSGQEEILGETALVDDDFDGTGYVLFNGERWTAKSLRPLYKGQKVIVNRIDGLTLHVSDLEQKE